MAWFWNTTNAKKSAKGQKYNKILLYAGRLSSRQMFIFLVSLMNIRVKQCEIILQAIVYPNERFPFAIRRREYKFLYICIWSLVEFKLKYWLKHFPIIRSSAHSPSMSIQTMIFHLSLYFLLFLRWVYVRRFPLFLRWVFLRTIRTLPCKL